MSLVQRAHGGHERPDVAALRAPMQPRAERGDRVNQFEHAWRIESRLSGPRTLSAGRHERARPHVFDERAGGVDDRRRRGRRISSRTGGILSCRPSTSELTSTWPSQSGPAPMPMVGIASARGQLRRELGGNRLEHDRERAGVLQRERVARRSCSASRGSLPR